MERQMELGLTQLNKLPRERLTEEFLRICGSTRWAGKVSQTFPHASVADALQAMDKLWWFLEKEDWLEAFSAHPRIGDAAALRKKFEASAAKSHAGGIWEADEQKGAEGAREETLQSLVEYNVLYEERFGFIFLVCATGKTADEMLALLKERMSNEPEKELSVAAGEQGKITVLRFHKLLSTLSSSAKDESDQSKL